MAENIKKIEGIHPLWYLVLLVAGVYAVWSLWGINLLWLFLGGLAAVKG